MFQSTHSLRSATPECDFALYVLCVSIHALLAECDYIRDRGAHGCRGFNPRTPCGVRHAFLVFQKWELWFQSTHSLRSATEQNDEESNQIASFNPRTPCGVRHKIMSIYDDHAKFQSTHSLRSATATVCQAGKHEQVSIHALLAECDPVPGFDDAPFRGFNPRTPCGVRPTVSGSDQWSAMFQSTHSLRSATLPGISLCQEWRVSIHALLAECDARCDHRRSRSRIVSIHALLAECDRKPGRPSLYTEVSIHALLAECDQGYGPPPYQASSFNPRTPCGVRQSHLPPLPCMVPFQSTHSLRSATTKTTNKKGTQYVSIHALLAECDWWVNEVSTLGYMFQSTHSLRSATQILKGGGNVPCVSIHALLAECDLQPCNRDITI